MGIAVGCVLPPLVHLITGPLGPFIGGFVAANRSRPGARGRLIIAVIIGTGIAGAIATAARIFVGLVGRSELPRWFPSTGTLMAIVGAAWAYGMAMAAAGAAVSNALARRGHE
jgi:protein-S-isoprenylcysteine O-methyltransferase Ste14